MHRILVALLAISLATPAFADAPGKGTFGTGATFGGLPVFNAGNVSTLDNGINGRYFITEDLLVFANLGLLSTENAGTQFTIGGGVDYYFMRGPNSQFSPFVGAGLGVIANSPSGADSRVGVLFLVGGGAEYFVNRHFGAQIMEGLQLIAIKDATSFAMVTRVGLNWYF